MSESNNKKNQKEIQKKTELARKIAQQSHKVQQAMNFWKKHS